MTATKGHVILTAVFVVVIVAVTASGIWSAERATEYAYTKGFEVGLCTFYVGVDRGTTPEESYAMCNDDDLRPTLLPDVPVTPEW